MLSDSLRAKGVAIQCLKCSNTCQSQQSQHNKSFFGLVSLRTLTKGDIHRVLKSHNSIELTVISSR